MNKIHLKSGKARHVLSGHPWIFSGAIEKADPLENGDLCEVHYSNRFVGIGYYNARTDIAVRIITRVQETIDCNFFKKRFVQMSDQKTRFCPDTNAFRLVFGESDALPGLIVDKYGDVLVVQFHTLGMEKMQKMITEALCSVFSPACIYQKNPGHSTKIEGAAVNQKSVLHGTPVEEVEILENGRRFRVQFENSQKTGFFLDQRENRKSLLPYAANRTVLDCFSYTGGFGVYAASAAKKVTCLDISSNALESAKENFKRNGFDPEAHEFICADAFEFLKNTPTAKYDLIILDPPSLAKSRKQTHSAIMAYTALNTMSLQRLPQDGILVSASCTAHVDEDTFRKILHQSAVNAKCGLKVLHSSCQPFDHAYSLHFPEGKYLKFYILLKTES